MAFATLGALFLASSAQSVWDDPAPTGRWAASTQQLASRLLAPEMAADAVSHIVGRGIFQGGPPSSVRFEGRPKTTGDGFCVRKLYSVPIHSRPGSSEGEPQKAAISDQIRLGHCEGVFAHVNPGATVDDAKKVLRWLEWARLTARGKRPLPFELACRSETTVDRCAIGARAVLASLPLEKTSLITNPWQRPPHNWDVGIVETKPGDLLWDVKIDATPGQASIDLTWKLPAPF